MACCAHDGNDAPELSVNVCVGEIVNVSVGVGVGVGVDTWVELRVRQSNVSKDVCM